MKKILRPLPPHLTLFMSQLTSTFPISHRISGAFLATMVLFSPILCPKMGLISLTHQNFYQSSPNSSKFLPILVGLTAFALVYHLFHGVRHLVKYVRQKMFDLECFLYFTLSTSRLARIAILYLIIFFLLFIILRTGCTLIALCWRAFAIPLAQAYTPLARLMMEYILQPHQDPEWVEYVFQELLANTGPADLEQRVARFLNIEQACKMQGQIKSTVAFLSAQSGVPVPQDCIDMSVMEIIERANWEYDKHRLGTILDSLAVHGTEAPFYQEILEKHGDFLRRMSRWHLQELERRSN